MQEKLQKKWKKPELIILQKGEMQEAVLTTCKSISTHGNPETGTVGQTCGNPNPGSCAACQARPPKS